MLRWKDKSFKDMDRQKLFKNAGVFFILGISIFAMLFFGIMSPKSDSIMLAGQAAKVGAEKISSTEFQRAYRNMSERFQAQYQEGFAAMQAEIPRYVMRQLVDERLMYQAAVNAGIEAQEADVIKVLRDAKAFQDESGKFNKDSFTGYLRGQGYTEASFTNEIRRSLTIQEFRSFVNSVSYVSKKAAALDYKLNETKVDVDFLMIEPKMVKVVVSQDEITKFLDEAGKAKVKIYYEGHASEFNTKEKIKARHILISYTGARNAAGEGALRGKDDAKKRAEDVLRQVKAPGADFAKLAVSLTDEPSGKTRGGDLGLFGREDMVKEFSDAAFALNAGGISGVVESPFGFHIIKVEEKQNAKSTTLEQATNDIAKRLLEQQKEPEAIKAKAEALFADVKAGKNVDAVLREIGAKWDSTGPVSAGAQSLPKVGGGDSLIEAVMRLAKVGDIADKVYDANGGKVIVKLKSRTEADESKLDAKKQKELAQAAASNAGYALLNSYEKSIRKELEEKGKIWENPEYLSLGRRPASAPSEEDAGG